MGLRENRAYSERLYFFLVLSRSERILCLWASASRWQRLYFFPLPHQQMSFRPVSAFSVSGTLLPLNKRSSSFTMLQPFLQYPNVKKINKKAAGPFLPCGCLFGKSQLTLYRLIISRFHVKLFACKCSFILWRTSTGRRIPLLLGQACGPPDLWPGKRGGRRLGVRDRAAVPGVSRTPLRMLVWLLLRFPLLGQDLRPGGYRPLLLE